MSTIKLDSEAARVTKVREMFNFLINALFPKSQSNRTLDIS